MRQARGLSPIWTLKVTQIMQIWDAVVIMTTWHGLWTTLKLQLDAGPWCSIRSQKVFRKILPKTSSCDSVVEAMAFKVKCKWQVYLPDRDVGDASHMRH